MIDNIRHICIIIHCCGQEAAMGSSSGTKTRTVVEVMSAIAVILTTAGLVVCIVVPSSIVGPILSLNVILWAILYRWMRQNNY